MTDEEKKAIPENLRHLYDFPEGWVAGWGVLDQGIENGASVFLVRFRDGKLLLLEDGRAVLYGSEERMATGIPSGVLYIAGPCVEGKEGC